MAGTAHPYLHEVPVFQVGCFRLGGKGRALRACAVSATIKGQSAEERWMNTSGDKPMVLHEGLQGIMDVLLNIVVSMLWLSTSVKDAIRWWKPWPYVAHLDCSVPHPGINLDKSILDLLLDESASGVAPVRTTAMANAYRVCTIVAKDAVWEHADFRPVLQSPELQFLRHLRNASAHGNSFYWGQGNQRQRTLASLPLTWRGKRIESALEGATLYFDFLSPGDLFVLLEDISQLVAR
jgi:hypothetical protein